MLKKYSFTGTLRNLIVIKILQGTDGVLIGMLLKFAWGNIIGILAGRDNWNWIAIIHIWGYSCFNIKGWGSGMS